MHRTQNEIERMAVAAEVSVQEAAQRLDEEGLGLVLVLDEAGALAGIMTNGDFRRFVLGGGGLSEKVTHAMNPTPAVVRGADIQESEAPLRKHFSTEGIRYVPVLGDHDRVQDVVFMTDLGASGIGDAHRNLPEDCPVVVMAGGTGSRLDPFTRILPKPLIPVGEKPIIEVILDRFAAFGVRNFWLSINHKGRMIRAYFEDAPVSYTVSFLDEDRPMGTAGALRQLSGRVDMPVFVTNCDIIVTADLSSIYDFHTREGAELTIVGSAQQHTIPYGVCELNDTGGLSRIVEKPSYDVVVNTGMYVLSPSVLGRIRPDRRVDMTELIEELLQLDAKVSVYPVPESAWLDVGQWAEYRKTVARLGGSDV